MREVQIIDIVPTQQVTTESPLIINTSFCPFLLLFLKSIPKFVHGIEITIRDKLDAAITYLFDDISELDPSSPYFSCQAIRQIFLKQALFAPQDKKAELLFFFANEEAKIILCCWDKYMEHLAEEAQLQRSSALKYQKRKEILEDQMKKFRIEKEEIQRQEVQRVLALLAPANNL